MYPNLGSNETPPQFPPPMVPGIESEGVKPNGVYRPSNRKRRNHSLQNFSASGVRFEISSRVIVVRESGGGLTGNGSVGEYHSPGVSPLGTGRSSTPNIGLPVLRSR